MENVQTELILSDIEVCQKKKNKKGMTHKEGLVWDKVFKQLDNGEPVRTITFTPDEIAIVRQLPLISAKPLIYACNIDADSMQAGSNALADKFLAYVQNKYPTIPVIVLSALLENEIVKIRNDDGKEAAREFMTLYGLEESRLDLLLEHCSNVLSLQKFYTAGSTQVSSWFVEKGATAPQAAGKIHSHFETKFICAEICKVDDWVAHGSEEAVRAKNKMLKHGKDYVMQENDVVFFHHSAR